MGSRADQSSVMGMVGMDAVDEEGDVDAAEKVDGWMQPWRGEGGMLGGGVHVAVVGYW